MFNRIRELIEKERNYTEYTESHDLKEQSMSKTAELIINFLDCDCKYYPTMNEDNEIICGYVESLNRAKDGEFIPVVISVNKAILDTLIMNTIIDSDDDSRSILDSDFSNETEKNEIFKTGVIKHSTRKIISEYRKSMISKDFSDGKELLDEMIDNNREYFGGYEIEKDELEVNDKSLNEDDSKGMDLGNSDENDINNFLGNNILKGIWDYEKNPDITRETIIAEIPVKNPWEIFAYIPFGGWNDCPSNEDIMSISKYWFEKYNAIPFAISHNTLEYIVENPVADVDKIRFAEEFYAFCPDRVDKYMEDFKIDTLEKKIYGKNIWYFYWN